MFDEILQFVHYGMILIFGVYLSAAFIGIQMNWHNMMILLRFSAILGTVNVFFLVSFGLAITEQVYPLIIHFPLILFFRFFYKCKFDAALLSVFVTYLCCRISNWVGIFFLQMTGKNWVYYSVRIIIDVMVLILFCELYYKRRRKKSEVLSNYSVGICIYCICLHFVSDR